MPPRPRPPRRTPPSRSARALVGALAATGLIVSHSVGLDAGPGRAPARQEPTGTVAASVDPIPVDDPIDDDGRVPVGDPVDDDQPAGAVATDPAEIPADGGRIPGPDDEPALVPTGLDLDETEVVAQLERIIRANKEELKKQEAHLDDSPDSSYHRAEGEYQELSDRFKAAEAALEEATGAGAGEEALAKLREELDDVARLRDLAKVRFELEIRDRRAAKEQVDILTQAIASDEARLRQLLGEEPAPPTDPATPTADPAAPAPPTTPDDTPSPAPAEPVAPAPAPATTPTQPQTPTPTPTPTQAPTETQPDPAPSAPTLPGLPGLPAIVADPASPAEPEPRPVSEEETRARREVEEKADAAAKAGERMQSLDDRLALIDRKLASVREQLANAQLKADNARETRNVLSEEFQNKSFDGADPEVLRPLRTRIREAENAAREATLEVRDRTARLEAVREERDLVLEAREGVFREATEARLALEMAEAALKETVNPFSPRNLRRWIFTRGPGLLSIIVIAALLIWLINRFGSRVASMMAQRGTRGSLAEREDRAKTLISVFENASSAAIVIGAAMMALDYAGVPIAPLLGGAAVLGLAISFGAQNLVSDFFYGFMILLENQYKLNDVVKINEHSGQVERISLRMTALRDLEGNLHFIPNGQITSVINMTHGWSRALFDVGVAYKEDVDRVIAVLIELGKELKQDPKFRPLILEDPTMLGVDGFGDSAVMIKFFIKTRPLQQWAVKRELNRRIKNRFDELGIEIPFPHRTVYHRTEGLGPGRFTIEAGSGNGDDLANGDPHRI